MVMVMMLSHAWCDAGQAWVETWLVREWCNQGVLTDALLRGWLQLPNSRSVDPALVIYCASQVNSYSMPRRWMSQSMQRAT